MREKQNTKLIRLNYLVLSNLHPILLVSIVFVYDRIQITKNFFPTICIYTLNREKIFLSSFAFLAINYIRIDSSSESLSALEFIISAQT